MQLSALALSLGASLLEALEAIDAGASNVAVLLDEDSQGFLGIVTDGDLRRALIGGASLSDPVDPFVRRDPLTVGPEISRTHVLDLMTARNVSQVPVVAEDGSLVGMHLLREMVGCADRSNVAVVMAGGRGTRLHPLTDQVPKPMLPVAGRPILERIVLHLVGSGFRRVVLSTGYLGDQIEAHFGDGGEFGCQIEYVRDDPGVALGSGGALAAVAESIELPPQPLVVMNGDLVTQVDLGALLGQHEKSGAVVTIATRPYVHEVPFGVVEHDSFGRVLGFEEKPHASWSVSSGIYVLEPSMLKRVPSDREFPMTELIADALDRGEYVHSWMFTGDWHDVGRPEDLSRARGE